MNTINLSAQNLQDVIQTVVGVLRDWGVEAEQQVILLGLPEDTRARTLKHYLTGKPFPAENTFLQRAHYILAIQNAVSSLYPHNPHAANFWVTTDNFFFGEKTPLDLMLSHGLEGMSRVLDHLNGIDDWG
jgi:hypothetical protein